MMFSNLYEVEDDLTESLNIKLTDDVIDEARCSIIAYNCRVAEDEQSNDAVVYNPKKNPDKAVIIRLEYPSDNLKIDIFLDTESKEWDNSVTSDKGTFKLSPDQMGCFFDSSFYNKVKDKLFKMWPKKDDFFSQLLNSIQNKKIKTDCCCGQIEEDFKFRKHNVKKGKAREKNAAGEQIRTNSGRLIEKFTDLGVQKGKNEAYYSWPGKKGAWKRWSRWADWEKQKPILRCRFTYNNELIGCSLGPIKEANDNRGFRSFNLSLQPPLQYLTPGETESILRLTIVRKFLKEGIRRITETLEIPDEEILANLNNPEKCTIDDIRKTKHVIKNSLEAAKNLRADTYIYD